MYDPVDGFRIHLRLYVHPPHNSRARVQFYSAISRPAADESERFPQMSVQVGPCPHELGWGDVITAS